MLAQKRKFLAIIVSAIMVCAIISVAYYALALRITPDSQAGDHTNPQDQQKNSTSQQEIHKDEVQEDATAEPKPTPVASKEPEPTGSTGSEDNQGNKEASVYASGWINITDKAGEYFDVTHNVGSANISVVITGKTSAGDQEHQWQPNVRVKEEFNCSYGGYSVVESDDGGFVILGYTSAYKYTTQGWLGKENPT